VDAGMEDLEKFAVLLQKVLRDGEKVSITIKGFCSPLASTDYNINLAKRRISSLRNYFAEYQNGVFVPYFNNTKANEGSIAFFDEEIGELKARANVSDDYYDTKNSVYSPAAAIERKIQIIAISTASSKTLVDSNVPSEVKQTEPIQTSQEKEKVEITKQQEVKKDIKPIATEAIRVPQEKEKVQPQQQELKKEMKSITATTETPKEKTDSANFYCKVCKTYHAKAHEEKTASTDEAKSYDLQVSGHSQLANAETTQDALKLVFTNPIIIVSEGGLYKVRITGFKTKEEAKTLIPKLEWLGITDAFVVPGK
jgi:hypothetical protein